MFLDFSKCLLINLYLINYVYSFIHSVPLLTPKYNYGKISKSNYNKFSLKSKNDFYTEIKNCETTLDDVAGLTEAKEEIMDVIDFLKDPSKYIKMGARIPRGILLHGNPGTGKTLLAKAIAGEAKVPFFATSGSNFVEVYVGVGASRIRNIFDKARNASPAIIFIDELDGVGSSRSSSLNRNDERDTTLNQLLTEMDGFNSNNKIVVIATTNRIDLIDKALIRSGRFDKKIYTGLPDYESRLSILNIHKKNKRISPHINLDFFASQMIGFSGADIETVLNDAAISACRKNKNLIDFTDIMNSYQKRIFGSKIYSKKIPENISRIIGIHELGHFVMSNYCKFDKCIYISIVPSNDGSNGITVFRPKPDFADNNVYTKEYLFSKIMVLLGGRAAEDLYFGEKGITTGAKADLNEAKKLLKSIIVDYSMTGQNELITLNVEEKVKSILEFLYKKTKLIISNNMNLIDYMNQYLQKNKEIYEKDIEKLIEEFDKI